MIEGLSHITLIVRDLAWTGRMLETVLDGKKVYRSGARGNHLFELHTGTLATRLAAYATQSQ